MRDDFFLPETRCDHYITEETKKLWAVEMECHEELRRVCEKHGIRYFAAAGTLLGTVRHKGFIPWDDDMDFYMLEEDYEKFCRIAPQEIKEPFFFQHYTTQEGFNPRMARIRKSGTTGATGYDQRCYRPGYHMGIFIDILPLTYWPKTERERKKQQRKYQFCHRAITGYEKKLYLKRTGAFGLKSLASRSILTWTLVSLFWSHEKLSEHFMKACSAPGGSDTVCRASFYGVKDGKRTWPKEDFSEVVMLPFEDTELPCPASYEEVLTRTYGDWQVFKKGTAVHSMAVMDTEHSYEEVMQGLGNASATKN